MTRFGNFQLTKLAKFDDMSKDVFRFKHFECRHAQSSMKIGVDAVLVGAWADVAGASSILDVGCGCGVIAMMCAQRNAQADVFAIDIDRDSVDEAIANFTASPWSSRLAARCADFGQLNIESEFATPSIDLIISNPPYFDDGISNPSTSRLLARHQAGLNPYVLLERGSVMISDLGLIAMVVPDTQFVELVGCAVCNKLSLRRACRVKGHPNAPVKRVLLEFCRAGAYKDSYVESGNVGSPSNDLAALHESIPMLTLELSPGVPTAEHRKLCADFYLKF